MLIKVDVKEVLVNNEVTKPFHSKSNNLILVQAMVPDSPSLFMYGVQYRCYRVPYYMYVCSVRKNPACSHN